MMTEHGDVLDRWDAVRGNAAGNEITEADGERKTELSNNEQRKHSWVSGGFMGRKILCFYKDLCLFHKELHKEHHTKGGQIM